MPGHSLRAISSSKISSPRFTTSSTRLPLTKASPASVAEAMSSRSSEPLTTNFACFQAKSPTSRMQKNLRFASPRARWKMLAPRITVLSTSKKAAPVRSGSTRRVGATSAAAADASPATCEARIASNLPGLCHATEPSDPGCATIGP